MVYSFVLCQHAQIPPKALLCCLVDVSGLQSVLLTFGKRRCRQALQCTFGAFYCQMVTSVRGVQGTSSSICNLHQFWV